MPACINVAASCTPQLYSCLPLCWEPCPQLSQSRLPGAAGAGSGCLPVGVAQSREAPATLHGATNHQSDQRRPCCTLFGPTPYMVMHSCHPVSDASTVTTFLQGTFEVGTLPSWASTKRPAGAVGAGTGLLVALLHRCSQAQEQGLICSLPCTDCCISVPACRRPFAKLQSATSLSCTSIDVARLVCPVRRNDLDSNAFGPPPW